MLHKSGLICTIMVDVRLMSYAFNSEHWPCNVSTVSPSIGCETSDITILSRKDRETTKSSDTRISLNVYSKG